jgi:cell division protein FtsI/penicillin-binding protein 2
VVSRPGRRGWTALVSLAVVLALVAAGVVLLRERAEQRRRDAVAAGTAFLTAWQERRYADMDALAAAGDAPGDAYRRTDERLLVQRVDVRPGPLSEEGDRLPFDVTLGLGGLGDFSYAATLDLRETEAGWRVAFRASTLHPFLTNGQRLDRRRDAVPRGRVLDRDGRPVRELSGDLAANVLGSVGPAPEATETVLAGEQTGLTGLERVLDDRLAGQAGGAVVVVDAATEQEVATLQTFAGTPGEDVRTTLDLDVQAAAEQALQGLPSRAALVAVDTATGEVRAVANEPVAGLPASFASYAPGSVFKVVTATALLQAGTSPATTVDCPATVSVGGRAFRNDEGLVELGRVPFSQAFARSCNTTMISLSRALPDDALQRAAELYGFGRTDLLPIAVEGGEVPEPAGEVEAAAAAIGQGRVEASPLLIASMSAAVASGTWQQPRLLPGEGASTPLPPEVVDPLRGLMRGVVTSGTGRAADLPGPPVHGKTGTAQYGTGDPPPTHAWFTGFRGDLAFAVFVETGASGGQVAAPAARRFLAALPG